MSETQKYVVTFDYDDGQNYTEFAELTHGQAQEVRTRLEKLEAAGYIDKPEVFQNEEHGSISAADLTRELDDAIGLYEEIEAEAEPQQDTDSDPSTEEVEESMVILANSGEAAPVFDDPEPPQLELIPQPRQRGLF